MKASDLFALFADVARKVKPIKVGELELHIRQISALERDEYFAWVTANTTKERWVGSSSYLAALGLCDPAGVAWFTDPAADYKTVGASIPGHVVEAIAKEVLSYNLMGPTTAGDLAKN